MIAHENNDTAKEEYNVTSIHDDGAIYATQEEYAREIRKWRTEIPNIVFEMGLTGDQIGLYAHIKRRAGAKDGGKCTEGLRGIATTLRRSKDSVSRDLEVLVEKDLVEVGEQPREDRPRPIMIKDIWPENYEHFSGKRLEIVPNLSHHRDRVSHQGDRVSREEDKGVSPGGQKNEHIKNELSENGTSEEVAATRETENQNDRDHHDRDVDHVRDIYERHGGKYKTGGSLPATEKQIDYLEDLAADQYVYWEDFEEVYGPVDLENLTRVEASRLIDALKVAKIEYRRDD
jgi:hypothetical protein